MRDTSQNRYNNKNNNNNKPNFGEVWLESSAFYRRSCSLTVRHENKSETIIHKAVNKIQNKSKYIAFELINNKKFIWSTIILFIERLNGTVCQLLFISFWCWPSTTIETLTCERLTNNSIKSEYQNRAAPPTTTTSSIVIQLLRALQVAIHSFCVRA